MNFDPLTETAVVLHSDKQNRSLIITSWVLISLVCLISMVPFLGFASWFIAGPILFIALVMGIIILCRGGTLPGLAILLTSLLVAPFFIVVAPFVTSFFGFGSTVAANRAGAELVPRTNTSQAGEFEQLKIQVQSQSEQLE